MKKLSILLASLLSSCMWVHSSAGWKRVHVKPYEHIVLSDKLEPCYEFESPKIYIYAEGKEFCPEPREALETTIKEMLTRNKVDLEKFGVWLMIVTPNLIAAHVTAVGLTITETRTFVVHAVDWNRIAKHELLHAIIWTENGQTEEDSFFSADGWHIDQRWCREGIDLSNCN